MKQTEFNFIEFNQNEQKLIVSVLPFQFIDTNSEVLVYGDVENGYQRKPEPKHYNKIRDYINTHLNSFVLPTSIILGIDIEDLDKLKNKQNKTLDFSIKMQRKIFRIVDGQHRIEGLRAAVKTNLSIKQFELPIIIVVTSKKRRAIELDIFNDINSKAKRIKVDLVQLARYNYRLREDGVNATNFHEHICIRIAYLLKEPKNGDESSVWLNGIKFDIHNDNILGIVGINSFMESISLLAKSYIKFKKLDLKKDNGILLHYIDDSSKELADLLTKCWNDAIKIKWPDAFDSKQIQLDIDESLKGYYYKKDYYIQKTIGVKALNGLIGEVFKESNDSLKITFNNFKNLITKSKITNSDWRAGGKFTGLSSESGVNKVKQLILNN